MSSSAAHLLPVAITVSLPNAVLSRASLRTDVQPVTPLTSSSSQTRGCGWSRSTDLTKTGDRRTVNLTNVWLPGLWVAALGEAENAWTGVVKLSALAYRRI